MQLEPAGRESLNGWDFIIFQFSVGKEALKDLEIKPCAKTTGRLWFDEANKVLVNMEGKYRGEVVLARRLIFVAGRSIPKGTRWSWRLEKVDGDWRLVRWEQLTPGLTSLFQRIWWQRVFAFTNYKRLQ